MNDVWALRADPELASVAAAFHVPVILMHNRSNPASVEVREQLGNAYIGSTYENLMEDVKRELLVSVELAKKAGIEESHIILDPGIGFGKTREHNLELINRLDEIRAPGVSRTVGSIPKIIYRLYTRPARRPARGRHGRDGRRGNRARRRHHPRA